jgi:hypothetical protein
MALDRTYGERGTPVMVKIALVLAIIGAINWGLIGFFNFNLVDAIFGGDSREMTSTASRIVYAIVGLAGLASLAVFSRDGVAHHRMEAAPHSR